MKQTFKKYIAQVTFLIAGLFIATSLSIAGAQTANWTAPTANPPGNNIDAPINVGSAPQTKVGPLTVGGAVINGGFMLRNGQQGAGKILVSDADGLATWDENAAYSNPIIAINVPYDTVTNIPANRCKNAVKVEMSMDGIREDFGRNDPGQWNWFALKNNGNVIGTITFGSRKGGNEGHGWSYWVSGMTRIIYLTNMNTSHSLVGELGTNANIKINNYTVTGGTGLPTNTALNNPSYSVICL